MSRFNLMSWGKDDDKTGGIRGRIGQWMLKQAMRLIPVEDFRAYHWYPDGYTMGDNKKQHVVLSDDPVRYWSDSEKDKTKVYVVRHDTDGVLGLFWLWTEARSAASLLSQEYEGYHFREYALNQEEDCVQIAEDQIDSLEQNLYVEPVPLYRKFDYYEWPEESRVINGDNVRTFKQILERNEAETIKRT